MDIWLIAAKNPLEQRLYEQKQRGNCRMRSSSKSWATPGADFTERKSVLVWSKVTLWFKAKKREYLVDHWSHFLWEGQFFCLGNNSVVLLLCKVTSAWNLNRVAATWGGKYDIKLMCFLKHSLRDTQAIILGMDSTQGWMFLVLMCVLAPTCRDNTTVQWKFQFSHEFPSWSVLKKRKCLHSPSHNAVRIKTPRECIHFLRQAFKITVYFFESVVYLKTIYCKSKKIVDNKKNPRCDDNKKTTRI